MHKSFCSQIINKVSLSLCMVVSAMAIGGCDGSSLVDGRSFIETRIVEVATDIQVLKQDSTLAVESHISSPTPVIETSMQTYVVQRGDTLYGIAAMFGTKVDDIVRENDIIDRNRIYPGQVLKIPTPIMEQVTQPPLFTPTETLSFTTTLTATHLIPSSTSTLTNTHPLCPPIPSDIPATENPILVETFDSSSAWDLSDKLVISGGELSVLSAKGTNFAIVPNTEASQFYLGVDIKITNADNTNAVIGFGNLTEQRDYHFITINDARIDIYQVSDGRERFTSSTQMNLQFSCYQRIELIYFADQVQLFINGEITSIAQLPAKGSQIALGTQYRGESGDGNVFFDNLEISLSRN